MAGRLLIRACVGRGGLVHQTRRCSDATGRRAAAALNQACDVPLRHPVSHHLPALQLSDVILPLTLRRRIHPEGETVRLGHRVHAQILPEFKQGQR
jgi:hypothetical protein